MSLPYRWRNRAAVLALVVGIVLVVRASARQTTFYIDASNPKCVDSGAGGSAGTPYCKMSYAATIANAGDTFLVSGPKHGFAPVTFTRPGTAANPITWRAVGTVALAAFDDVNDATFTPSGTPNVWQIPWTLTSGKVYQTFFDDIVVDDPNQTYFTLKDEDGPLVMTPVLTLAEVAANDGSFFRDAANQRMLVHPYGNRTPSTTNTDFVIALGNSMTLDTKANYQVFDGFTITYTGGTSGLVLSSNNKFYNMHYVATPLNVYGNNNYFENITINNCIWRQGPLWDWDQEGEGATGGFVSGTGHVMKNLHVFNSWNASFNSETSDGNIIDGARFHGAPNHCTGAANGTNIVRNAAWWNCQDFEWLADPINHVLEQVVIPGGGISMSAIQGNIGPITIRNSIFGGGIVFVRGTGTAAGLPYEGCTWEAGSLIEYNVISEGLLIERCDTQISYPVDEYIARCASGEFTGCATIRNNIKVPGTTAGWKTVIVDGMWVGVPGAGIGPIGEQWNFQLVPGSPAINAGMVSGAVTDLIGISRPQPVGGLYDIGAYEFTPGGDPAPTGKPIVAAPAAVTTTITAPTSAATYDAGTSATLTTLAGTSKSGRTITGCTWTNSLGGSGSTSGTTSWTIASVALTVGSNVITVTCTNDGKTTGADIITVTRSSGGGSVWACEDTHPAANATYATVNTLVQSASVDDGDCVTVPAGTQSWGSTLTITNKSIQLVGAGIGQTIITNTSSGPLIQWVTEAACTAPCGSMGGFARISGFTTRDAGSWCDGHTGTINVLGNTANFRFDHNDFTSSGGCIGLAIHDFVRGVIDNNVNSNTGFSIRVAQGIWNNINSAPNWAFGGGAGVGDSSWAAPLTLGTANAMYIEDNVFSRGAGGQRWNTDDDHGGRSVYRFNTWNGVIMANHGTETGGRPRSVMQWEVYRNDFVADSNPEGGADTRSHLRGGTGMIFDNDGTGATINKMFDMAHYRHVSDTRQWDPFGGCGTLSVASITRSGTTATLTTTAPHKWGSSPGYVEVLGAVQTPYNGTKKATGTGSTTMTFTVSGSPATPATGTITIRSPFDGNTNSTGVLCLDQPGAGPGDLLSGDSFDDTITPTAFLNQVLAPIYIWNNLNHGSLSAGDNQGYDTIVNNVHFYNQAASFTGATGIGRGTRASRPATCTTGVAYWSTDGGANWNTSTTETYSSAPGADGGLDKCTATNTWTNDWYVPYTYPHPLRGGT